LSSRTKFIFDIPINRRPPHPSHEPESRRQQTRSSDVLLKARALGIKIWALEKLQRMMTTMFEHDTGHQAAGPNTRGHSASNSIPRSARETDLSKLLRNERINGPSDRDPTVATKELILFKGPYIYIHDIDEKQKPIMVREYAKVQHKEDGDWPQFRSVSNGKCPFVGEVDYDREAAKEKERARAQQRQQKLEQGTASRTRAVSAGIESKEMQPPRPVSKRVFTEASSNRNLVIATNQVDPFAPAKFPNPSSSKSHQNAFVSRAGAGTGRLFAGEPVASGVQPNITSAIRSQISSTAAQPGTRVGTSKEIYGLQRKVLEKNSGGPASYGHASSHRMTDITTAAREDSGSQHGKRKNPHTLAQVDEDANPSEAEEVAKRTVVTRKAKAEQQRKATKKDAKPGYCENCQDKFDDFDEVCHDIGQESHGI
jgi:regulatory subunit for Cdc7p protein kinase